MNFMKKFLVKEGIKSRIKALKKIETLLLLVLDFFTKPWPANSSYFLVELINELIQRLCQLQDPRIIIKKKQKMLFF